MSFGLRSLLATVTGLGLRNMLGITMGLGLLAAACGHKEGPGVTVIFPGSSVGAEAEVLHRQLGRFMSDHPGIRVVQRETPDAADQRHQLYVQWLSAGTGEPDILQCDVIWTAEFAAAGWITPLERFAPPDTVFFEACRKAARWQGHLYALPWFVDVGMLYWRTDLLDGPPRSLEELASTAAAAQARAGLPYGFVWQGARYEGLVCVFLEHLGCFGGRILDDRGRVQVDSPAALAALRFMTRSIRETRIVPEAVLTWQEEQTRFAFQNGDAVYMRNWPYAYPLMADSSESAVAGKFAIAPMPPAANGAPTAALGGSLLAINAQSKHPEAAYAVIEYLTRPEQMRERAEVAGQYPTRRELYYDGSLTDLLPIPPEQVRTVIENAVPRPSTPVYTELSSLLQIRLHRALSGQVKPAVALANAAADLRRLLHEPALGASPGGSP